MTFRTFGIDLDAKARGWAVKWALKISDDCKLQFPEDQDENMLMLLAGLLISAHASLNGLEVGASTQIAGMLAEHVHKEVAAVKAAEKAAAAKP